MSGSLRFLGRLAFSSFLIWLVLRRTDLVSLAGALEQVDWRLVVLAFALNLPGLLVAAYRWNYLLKIQGEQISLRSLLASYLVGHFFNLFLPTNVGGDISRAYDTGHQRQRSTIRSALVILVERVLGFSALMLIASLASLLSLGWIGQSPQLLILFLVFFSGLLIFLGILFSPKTRNLAAGLSKSLPLPGTARAKIDVLFETLGIFGRQPGRLLLPLGLSFFLQANWVIQCFLLAWALNIQAPFWAFFVFVPMTEALAALPITISGIGLRENSYAYFLKYFAVGASQSISLAWLALGLRLLLGLIGAGVYLLRRFDRPRP